MILSSNRTHFDGSCAAARTNTLASLRGSIAASKPTAMCAGSTRSRSATRVPMHCCAAGLRVAAVHEVFAEGHQGAAATGFIAGIAGRVSPREAAGLGAAGILPKSNPVRCRWTVFLSLGLDPRLARTIVRAADVEVALRSTADALACDALGAVVLEVFGDLVPARSRRQPQADACCTSFRGSSALLSAHRCEPCAFRRRDALDRARGVSPLIRAVECVGCAARSTQASSVELSWPGRAGGSWNGNVMSAASVNLSRILSLWLPRLPHRLYPTGNARRVPLSAS